MPMQPRPRLETVSAASLLPRVRWLIVMPSTQHLGVHSKSIEGWALELVGRVGAAHVRSLEPVGLALRLGLDLGGVRLGVVLRFVAQGPARREVPPATGVG